MKLLVAVKRVIDYNVKVRVKSDRTDVDLANVKMSLNPFCEIAVEEAVRLKEKGVASEVLVVSIGSKACQEQLRTALALGADRAIQVEGPDNPDSLSVARILAEIVKREDPGLILLGKQSIDSDNNQTGQMLAALIDRPQATFISEIMIEGDQLTATREVDGGLQTLQLTLPAVVTTDLRLNEPRYASLPNIMKAKKKSLDVMTADELGVNIDNRMTLVSVEPSAERSAGIKVSSVTELVDKLRQEAKVIA